MSVREEDRKKSNCTSRGLGVAAAAIGVGVGAALYYYFSKKEEENPHEGASSSGAGQHQAFLDTSEEYTSISVHTTTDTSMFPTTFDDSNPDWSNIEAQATTESNIYTSVDNESDSDCLTISTTSESSQDSHHTTSESDSSDSSIQSISSISSDSFSSDVSHYSISSDIGYQTHRNSTALYTDLEGNDWDVTTSSVDIPSSNGTVGQTSSTLHRFLDNISAVISPRGGKRKRRSDEERDLHRAKVFRERSWSLEECSICFDVILKDQKVTSLPCTHHFHSACIEPWLSEQQTCPNCRKNAE